MKKNASIALLLACCVGLAGCSLHPAKVTPPPQPPPPPAAVQNEQLCQIAPPKTEVISHSVLLAVGDNLIHDTLYIQRKTDSGYDFKPLYTHVADRIAAADLAFINQETMMTPDLPPSSYPMFNTPTEMAGDLRDIGFDLLSLANNHMLDKGSAGLLKTQALIASTQGLSSAGGYPTAEAQQQTTILERNGIRFAFVSFTQHTNGLPRPADQPYLLIYTDESDTMRTQIEQARAAADVVVVSVHWGEENTHQTTDYQQNKAQEIADLGADVILGTHPHVLQPVELLSAKDGRQVPVIYSLGNFVSGQVQSPNLIGGMAEITVQKNQTTGKVTIEKPVITPLVTHYDTGMRNVTVYPLEQYTDTLAAQHGIRLTFGRLFRLDDINRMVQEVIAPEYLADSYKTALQHAFSQEGTSNGNRR